VYKLLIVDDEQIERRALRHIVGRDLPALEVAGEARNGQEAVELVREHEPQIVLMDIKMPGKSGLEAAREIHQSYPETKIIMLTAFDYFDYAQTALQIGAVDYLLKPIRPQKLLKALQNCIDDLNNRKSLAKENKRIKEQLAKLWPYLESSFIYDLVNGNIMNERDLRQRASILGINLIPAIVMLIGIEHPGNLDGGISEFKQQLTRQKVFEVILGIFNDNKSILITPIMANKFILLIPCISAAMSTVHYDYCRLKGEAIIKKLTEDDIVVSIGIGNYYEDVNMIRQSYLEAQAAQRGSSFAGGDEVVSYFGRNKKDSTAFSGYIYQKEAEILDLMYMGDWDGTARVLEFLWKNIRDSNLEEQLQKACALELLIVLYRAAVTSEADTQPMAVLSLSRIRRLMESNTAEELGNCFYMAVHEIMDAIKMGRTDSAAQAVHMTKSFIDNNLSSDIKLDDVARHVHMSPCYLSRIFSREVGVPFKKYMVKAKLAHARKLLLSTAKSISEIATEVGYQDTSYFCKIFRQDEGLSPNEYRIKHRPKKI